MDWGGGGFRDIFASEIFPKDHLSMIKSHFMIHKVCKQFYTKNFTKPINFSYLLYVFPLCIVQNYALTIRPPAKWPLDILTCTDCPPNVPSALPFYYCAISTLWCFTTATFCPQKVLLLWHFVPVIFYYCNSSSTWHCTTATFRPLYDSPGNWRPRCFSGGHHATVLRRPSCVT